MLWEKLRLKSRVLYVALLLLALSSLVSVADAATLTGRVVDAVTGKGLPSASVLVSGSKLGVATNNLGYFELNGIPEGTVQLTVQMIGYQSQSARVHVPAREEVVFKLQPQPIQFDGIVVTALRESQMRSDLSQPTDYLRVPELLSENWLNVGEALERQGNVFIKDYGDLAAPKTVSMRGSTEGQVLVLLDGNRLNLPQGGGVDFSTLPLEGMDHMEITRGASSALYGSDAVAGVINLIPAGADGGPKVGVTTTLGSFGLKRLALHAGRRLGKVGLWLTGARIKSLGDYPYTASDGKKAVRKNNDYDGTQFLGGASYAMGASGKISLLLHTFDKDQGDPGMLGYESQTARKKEKRRFVSLHFERQFRRSVEWSGAVYHNGYDQRYSEPAYGINSKHLNGVTGLQTQVSWSRGNDLSFVAGYEFRSESLNSSDVGRRHQDLHGLFLLSRFGFSSVQNQPGARARVSKLYLIPILRMDHYSGRTTELNPRLGIVYSLAERGKITLRGNVGRSFRMPSFFDLYWPASAWSAGNPDLKPEVGITYDGGAIWQIPLGTNSAGGLSQFLALEVTYFANRMRDLILWAADDNGIWKPQNVAMANVQGVETQAQWNWIPAGLTLQVSHTLMKAENATKGSPYYGKLLIYRPRNITNVRLVVHRGIARVDAVFRRVDRRFTTEDNTKSLPAYSTLDLTAEVTAKLWGLRIPLRAGVYNLLDRRFEVISGYPVPGRQFRFTFGLEQ